MLLWCAAPAQRAPGPRSPCRTSATCVMSAVAFSLVLATCTGAVTSTTNTSTSTTSSSAEEEGASVALIVALVRAPVYVRPRACARARATVCLRLHHATRHLYRPYAPHHTPRPGRAHCNAAPHLAVGSLLPMPLTIRMLVAGGCAAPAVAVALLHGRACACACAPWCGLAGRGSECPRGGRRGR